MENIDSQRIAILEQRLNELEPASANSKTRSP